MPPEYQGGWVVFDILPDLIERFVRSDDVFPVVALPNSSKPFRYRGFEGADHDGLWVGFLKDQNAMDMIRHHYKSIQRDIREMLRDLFPAGGNDVGNLVEDAAAISSADGYEVHAGS